jgi:hypothetical protein
VFVTVDHIDGLYAELVKAGVDGPYAPEDMTSEALASKESQPALPARNASRKYIPVDPPRSVSFRLGEHRHGNLTATGNAVFRMRRLSGIGESRLRQYPAFAWGV